MKVSLNWLKQFVDVNVEVDELVKLIETRLGAVESVLDLGKQYQGIVIAKVVSCQDHPDADRLHVCKIDDNHKVENIDRDREGLIQVVCGAQNVHSDMLVAWLPPGTTVPETVAKAPFVLEARDIRGQKSNGMLASPKELAFGDDNKGILEIDEGPMPGNDFASVYELNDYIIELENKMFTHRPDCFGQLGIAREIAGILGKQFTSPDWYKTPTQMTSPNGGGVSLEVRNELPELVSRFMVVALDGVTVRPSPILIQSYLLRLGVRPVNNVVDVTNYMMILTGQPMHAYDYDKVKSTSGDNKAVLVVRFPKDGEKLTLLGGKEIELHGEIIMIASEENSIGLGGVMGGAESEIDHKTTRLILECASFDMYSVRRTAMAYGLSSDAVTRFTKGQSPLQNECVLSRAMQLLTKYADAKQASSVVDNNQLRDRQWIHPPVPVTADFINSRLGLQLRVSEIKQLLENVECRATEADRLLTVTAPFWRTDIESREDVIEEIGRLNGYDKLPTELPKRSLAPAPKDDLLELKNKIRHSLSRAGANEILTYSFVRGALLEQAGQDKTLAWQLSNALSPDLQYYRLSLTPSLLDKVNLNLKAGYDRFVLFEIGKSHVMNQTDPNEPGIPKEANSLSLIFSDKQSLAGAPFYEARTYLERLLSQFHALQAVRFEPLLGANLNSNPWIQQMVAPFAPSRSAVLRDDEGLIWGVVGEFRSSVKRSLKLPALCAGFEIDPFLLTQSKKEASYISLPRFPKVEQDICLKVAADLTYQELFNFIWQKLIENKPKQTNVTLTPVDIYQRANDLSYKQITLRLNIASYLRSMTDIEVNALLNQLAEAAKTQFKAERL